MEHKRAYLSMLAIAIAARAISATGADTLARQALPSFDARRFGETAAAVFTGAAPEEESPEQRVWVLHRLAPEAEQTPPAPFEASEAAQITGSSGYSVDAQALLLAPLPFDAADAEVLIVHTHTSEAYTQTAGWTYAESDPMRTQDAAQSVVRVGEEIAEILNAAGVVTVHDTEAHDYPVYNGAYARTLEATERQLQKTPKVQVVLDIHRDANAGAKTVSVGGEQAALMMLVVGTDAGGLSHPNWRDNLSFALKLQAAAERRAAGICKPIDLRRERFNQHVRPGALIAEIGTTGNTLPEALATARVLAAALVDVLKT